MLKEKTAILTSSPYKSELKMRMTPKTKKNKNAKTVAKTVETKNACTVYKRGTKSADRLSSETCKKNAPRKVNLQQFL